MKFYDCKTAPSPRRVRIFLAEKGVEIDSVQVDLAKGEQFSDAFMKISPLAEVPLLVLDDGTVLSQVNAICRYLEEVFPENPLCGRTPVERAQVDAFNGLLQMNGFMAGAEAFRNATPGFKNRAMPGPHNYSQIPELAERGLLRLDNLFADLDAHFADNQFFMGDYYSMADISGLTIVDFAKWVKKFIPENCVHLQRWYDQVNDRPSAKA
ncbi:MAG: glutathione S-transferase family protein [Porticoccaceae bacterium]|jgi:glutathione S-transferase|nr:glutathione S-transferase family protein [Porticoccaceae bacterium]MBT7375871.1 glutathione S-transferase family protein [Porticoccaceae bacterium]